MVDKLGKMKKHSGQEDVAMETLMFTSLLLKVLLPCHTFTLNFLLSFSFRKILKIILLLRLKMWQ